MKVVHYNYLKGCYEDGPQTDNRVRINIDPVPELSQPQPQVQTQRQSLVKWIIVITLAVIIAIAVSGAAMFLITYRPTNDVYVKTGLCFADVMLTDECQQAIDTGKIDKNEIYLTYYIDKYGRKSFIGLTGYDAYKVKVIKNIDGVYTIDIK